jgi:flagellar basal body-associated protein FliL
MKQNINHLLVTVVIILVVGISAGTILAFLFHKTQPGSSLRQTDPEPGKVRNMNTPENEKLAAFTGISRIRAVTKPDPENKNNTGIPVVITPWFAYPEKDSVFYEEMARKSKIMEGIIVHYFSLYTEKELRAAGEEKIKADLLTQINDQFALGKITAIYFTDYIFLE